MTDPNPTQPAVVRPGLLTAALWIHAGESLLLLFSSAVVVVLGIVSLPALWSEVRDEEAVFLTLALGIGGVLLALLIGFSFASLLVVRKAFGGGRAWLWALGGLSAVKVFLLPWGFLTALLSVVGIAQTLEREAA